MIYSLKDLSLLLWGMGKAWFKFNIVLTFMETLDQIYF